MNVQTHDDKLEELKWRLANTPGVTLEDVNARGKSFNWTRYDFLPTEDYDAPVRFRGIHLVDRVLLALAEERLGY